MKISAVFALLLTACASTQRTDEITALAELVMRDFPETPSLALAVVHDGKPIVARGLGKRDVEANAASDERTSYYIASSTKSYVGLLAALLAHRGLVDLDAPITRYIPELRLPSGVTPGRVTLKTLLTHSAGLESDALVGRTAFTGEHSTPLLLDLVSRSEVKEAKFRYDNYGYVVAGLVLERVTGRKWQDLLHDEIFAPAGMRRTTAYISRAQGWPSAVPYWSGPDGLVRRPMLKTDATMHAAGGLVTTAEDLGRWLELNVNQGRMSGRQVLPREAFEIAHRQHVTVDGKFGPYRRTGYALGWYWSEFEGKTLLHHFGGFTGWRAHVSFMPATKTGVAAVTNSTGLAFDVPDLVANTIYDRLVNDRDSYASRSQELRASIEKERIAIREELAKRAARTPTLLREPSAYLGAFANDDWGTLTIRQAGSELRASLGTLDGKLEPFTEPDTARVELVPGSGEVLRFSFGSGATADSVKFKSVVFERVK